MLKLEDSATQETAANERLMSVCAFTYTFMHLTVDAMAASTFWGCREKVVDRKRCGA